MKNKVEELAERIKKELEDKLLIKCECENGGCPNCQRLCEVIDNIQAICLL